MREAAKALCPKYVEILSDILNDDFVLIGVFDDLRLDKSHLMTLDDHLCQISKVNEALRFPPMGSQGFRILGKPWWSSNTTSVARVAALFSASCFHNLALSDPACFIALTDFIAISKLLLVFSK